MEQASTRAASPFVSGMLGALIVTGFIAVVLLVSFRGCAVARTSATNPRLGSGLSTASPRIPYQSRRPAELSGFLDLLALVRRWEPDASLEEIRDIWRQAVPRAIEDIDRNLRSAGSDDLKRLDLLFGKVSMFNAAGETSRAYELLSQVRSWVEKNDAVAAAGLYTVIFSQGVVAMRRGENDNCIMCRGESSCILPIGPAAVHSNPAGSRLAIQHFTEYLNRFPEDLGGRWLLNLAHMTLDEYPGKVDSRFRLDLNQFFQSEFDIGRFRDIGHLVGVNRFNQAGGAIMEDFDNDGLLDLAVTTFDCTRPMAFWRNTGNGTFEDRSREAGVTGQLGGMVCYQADYDNDGLMDIFIPRGAWLLSPVRPSLLRNNGAGGFTDVTREAGLLDPVNSNAAAWADYDNDGWVDLFIGCERQTNRLYRNRGNGTFEEVAAKAGVQADAASFCKGCTWVDHDNDGYPDLFLNNLSGAGRLFHNNRDGTFTDDSSALGIDGPPTGFSCWAWDFNNDGWLDIFATCYERTLDDVVKGLLGQPHSLHSNRLFRNRNGKGFDNVTQQAGLNMVFATMGSNYADFDNDGWLDMYLGTGEPSLATLIPNRMFKNVGGDRFADITGTSGTGHLQKGHGVACGDWDRDGDVDLFVQTGGVVDGDRYHNILFQNPGQGNHWLTVKLVGKQTNRSAIGARIKVVTSGAKPLTVHRHVSSGSSFGANPLQQTVGLGQARQVAVLEIDWPTSKTKQIFRDIAADQSILVTEFAHDYRVLDSKPVPAPK